MFFNLNLCGLPFFSGEQFDEEKMTKRLEIVLLLGLFLCAISSANQEVSVACMMVYDEGGAPAVIESPECPQWGLYPRSQNRTGNCQFATLQGNRDYQEDRIICDLEMNIHFLGIINHPMIHLGFIVVNMLLKSPSIVLLKLVTNKDLQR